MQESAIPCTVVRGGTSKGLIFREDQLPNDGRDDTILSIFGSLDSRQVDGLGGATTTTSKVIFVRSSDQDHIDIEYTFGQVGIGEWNIDYEGNCGNMASAIGPFAVTEEMVNVQPDTSETTLVLYNTNTDSYMEQTVPVENGRPRAAGDYKIAGVSGTGARIDTTFLNPEGSLTGELYPLGEPTVDLELNNTTIQVSLVDVTTPVIFVAATDLNLEGTEHPKALNERQELLDELERIRGIVCEELGYVSNWVDAKDLTPNEPKVALIREPTRYRTQSGAVIAANEVDIVGRVTSMPVIHPTYAVTSACCTAAAVKLGGTIPYELSSSATDTVHIGHPEGIISVDTNCSGNQVHSVTIGRTQRRLMDGVAYYPNRN